MAVPDAVSGSDRHAGLLFEFPLLTFHVAAGLKFSLQVEGFRRFAGLPAAINECRRQAKMPRRVVVHLNASTARRARVRAP